MPRIGLVTDSTADLTADEAQAHDVAVVPLRVVVGDETYDGAGISAADLARAMRKQKVSTSRPTPKAFGQCYAELAESGVDEIVSVHLSSIMSATCEAAQIAARTSPVPVRVVDSRSIGLALGFGVLAAAERIRSGADTDTVVAGLESDCGTADALFYVSTLEHLRRGGRIGTARAVVGTALAVKPLLTLREGRIEQLENVRTTGRALARLVELAAQRAVDKVGPVRLAVQHLDAADRAGALAAELEVAVAETTSELTPVTVREVGPVIGAHVGPGMLAVLVSTAGGA